MLVKSLSRLGEEEMKRVGGNGQRTFATNVTFHQFFPGEVLYLEKETGLKKKKRTKEKAYFRSRRQLRWKLGKCSVVALF